MASPEVLDFAKLLAPIGGSSAAGVDLRADPSPVSDLYAIKGARSVARAAEKKLSQFDRDDKGEEPPPESPDWRTILERGTRILAERSKDLEVAAFLIEALVRLHGFAGLRDGFRLARELIERYWDDLYPRPDEDGLETRLAPLVGLNGEGAAGTLIVPIAMIPMTASTSFGRLCFANYPQAVSLAKISDVKVRDGKIAKGAVTLDMIQKAVGESDAGFFHDLLDDLSQGEAEFARLNADLGARCGGSAPASSNIRAAIDSCRDILKVVAREKLLQPQAVTTAVEGIPVVDGEPAATAPLPRPSGAIQDREDALRNLRKVADYFRATEPHSILPYALEQAIHWGRMSLPDLFSELIPEEEPRKSLFKQVGIRPPEPPSKSTAE